MQLREYFHHFIKELKPVYGQDEAQAISQMIFEHFAAVSRTDIINHPHHILENRVSDQLSSALFKLKQHIPVQQVIGHCHFLGLDFIVNPSVLIPRPETEELVRKAADFISKNNKKTVLDIGTGSGCIAVSIQYLLKDITVKAIDVSETALSVARQNAAVNNCPVKFEQLDFLNRNNWDKLGIYDVIISNPPYIPFHEKQLMSKNVVDHEPHLALFVPDEDALIFYREIASFATTHLAENGAIFLETHEAYAGQVTQCLEQAGFKPEIIKDIFEKERMVVATPNR